MRRLDWPERLDATIRAARTRSFSEVDYCVFFAADCVLAMTDVDPALPYRGLTKTEAISALGDTTLLELLSSIFGPQVHLSRAQRGDIVVRNDGDKTLGICIGQNAVFLSDEGVAYEKTLESLTAFKVL